MRQFLLGLSILAASSLSYGHGSSVIETIGDAVKAVGEKVKADAPDIDADLLGIKGKASGAKIEVKVYTNAEPKKPYTFLCEMVHPSGGGDEYFDCVAQPR